MTARGLIVAAPRSGAGKTTVTIALLAALKRRGIAVQAAKVGPDYIDPAFHAAATGRPSVNLDSWAMKPALLDALMGEAASDAEMLVLEGAMGLFDGIEAGPRRSGSTADLAARFGLPVLLVVDVSGQSQSAAALVRGFAGHDPEVRIGGVVLNRVGSERHRAASIVCRRRLGDSGPRRDAARRSDIVARAPSRAGAGSRARRSRPTARLSCGPRGKASRSRRYPEARDAPSPQFGQRRDCVPAARQAHRACP